MAGRGYCEDRPAGYLTGAIPGLCFMKTILRIKGILGVIFMLAMLAETTYPTLAEESNELNSLNIDRFAPSVSEGNLMTETISEAATEAVTETVPEAATEAVTEVPTEAATEAVTEFVTETATEEMTEAIGETEINAAPKTADHSGKHHLFGVFNGFSGQSMVALMFILAGIFVLLTLCLCQIAPQQGGERKKKKFMKSSFEDSETTIDPQEIRTASKDKK